MLQTPVEIVNPGGTGRPAFVISARPEPFPPSVSFIERSPSALPAPKKYTNFLPFAAFFGAVAAAFTAWTSAFATEPFRALPFTVFFAMCLRLRLRNNLGYVCERENEARELFHEPQ